MMVCIFIGFIEIIPGFDHNSTVLKSLFKIGLRFFIYIDSSILSWETFLVEVTMEKLLNLSVILIVKKLSNTRFYRSSMQKKIQQENPKCWKNRNLDCNLFHATSYLEHLADIASISFKLKIEPILKLSTHTNFILSWENVLSMIVLNHFRNILTSL